MKVPVYTWTNDEMIAHAQRAIGRIVVGGYRGATMVTVEETVALATCLLCLGVEPISGEAAKAILKPPHQPIDGDNAI